MDPKSTTFEAAVIRVNELAGIYGQEKIRLEDNFTKLLLPAGITCTAALLKDAVAPEYFGIALALGAFFLVYALLIYTDLFSVERAYLKALKLRKALYAHEGSDSSLPMPDVAPEAEQQFIALEEMVDRRRYTRATLKPLIAVAGAAAALFFHRLS